MYINREKLNVRRFSSGELKFLKSNLDKYIINNKVEILYTGKYSLFELLIVLKYYIKKDVLVDLIMAYLPYQRMDHEDIDELDTVNYVADIFNKLNLNSITICEPHCDISRFNNAKKVCYIDLIKEKVFEDINFNEEVDSIILADKGGVKRYGNISKNIVYFNKVRDIESGLIVKHEIVGNVDVNKNLVIIDDIISTGDTIVNIIDMLKGMGAKKIYVVAGHIENNKYNRRIFKYDEVIKVYSTNSLKKKPIKKLFLYDVKELFYKI